MLPLAVVLLLTALTQISGLVLWLCAPILRRLGPRLAVRSRVVRAMAAAGLLVGAYTLASLAAIPLAASFGRTPLPCAPNDGVPLAPYRA